MKHLTLPILLFIVPMLSGLKAQTVSQIQGYLEVFHPDDTTSIYIGREAGKLTNTSVIRNNTILRAVGVMSGLALNHFQTI